MYRLPLGPGHERHRPAALGPADAVGGHVAAQKLHDVVNRQRVIDHPAGAVDVQVDVLVLLLALQVEHLHVDPGGRHVVDLPDQEDDPVLQEHLLQRHLPVPVVPAPAARRSGHRDGHRHRAPAGDVGRPVRRLLGHGRRPRAQVLGGPGHGPAGRHSSARTVPFVSSGIGRRSARLASGGGSYAGGLGGSTRSAGLTAGPAAPPRAVTHGRDRLAPKVPSQRLPTRSVSRRGLTAGSHGWAREFRPSHGPPARAGRPGKSPAFDPRRRRPGPAARGGGWSLETGQ